MSDNEDLFDIDMSSLMAIVEEAEKTKKPIPSNINQSNNNNKNNNSNDNDDDDDDNDFDDFDSFEDINALMTAADTAEKQNNPTYMISSTTANYSIFNQPSTSRSVTNHLYNNNNNNNNNRITFGIPENYNDPTPPPPPPPDTRTYHSFDQSTIPTWIYPTNYPVRGYQFNIVKKALFSNTLVALPTGLGKTLIAAVVIYNYYRWFPDSIMIFMAPTKPLVEQQIEACYKVCGIPQSETEILMGTTDPKKRAKVWSSKRVFFATPQVVRNDIVNGVCPAHKISLLVIDEAHRATGGYAYTEVIEKLGRVHSHFRILALSATPGSKLEQVQSVVTNLKINNIEIRTEDSMDVQEFSFGKKIQRVVIRLDYTAGATGIVPQTARTFCEQLLQPVLERLKKRNAIFDAQPERCSPFALLTSSNIYRSNAKNVPNAVKSMVFIDFSIAQSLSRAYENLCTYGISSFVESMKSFILEIRNTIAEGKNIPKEKYKLLNHIGLHQLLDRLQEQMETPGFVGHPKLDNLTGIIMRHLTEHEDNNNNNNNNNNNGGNGNSNPSSTRIIVFSSLRTSVDMITKQLSIHEPLIRCAPFIGQGSDKGGGKGMNQKEQHETIKKLKKGEINVIIATSIGEEGLDIGEVDLIVCYDSQSSPVRLLQRMGRTGRKRQGHCVMLMTEQEERKYNRANDTYKSVQRQISNRNSIEYHEDCPSVLPKYYQPVLQRKFFNIASYVPSMNLSGKRKRRGDDGLNDFTKDGFLTTAAEQEFLESFNDNNRPFRDLNHLHDYYWPKTHPLKGATKYLPFQKELTFTKRISHSRRTKQFTSIINLIEQQIIGGGCGDDSTFLYPRNQDDGRIIADINIPSTSNTNNNNNNNSLIIPKKNQSTKELKLPQKRKNPITNYISPQQQKQKQKVNDYNDIGDDGDDDFANKLLTTGIAYEDNIGDEGTYNNNNNNNNQHPDSYDMDEFSDMVMEPLITKGVMDDDEMDDFSYSFSNNQPFPDFIDDINHSKTSIYNNDEDKNINNDDGDGSTDNDSKKTIIQNSSAKDNHHDQLGQSSTVILPADAEKKKKKNTTENNNDNNNNNNGDDDDFDDFGGMDDAFFENNDPFKVDAKKDDISKSQMITEKDSVFNLDDELPPVHINESCITVSNDFLKSFSWATTTPPFSENAKSYIKKKLKHNKTHQLLVKILSYQVSSKSSSDNLIINEKIPPLSPSSLPQSPSFGDDLDIEILDNLLDLSSPLVSTSSLIPKNNKQIQNVNNINNNSENITHNNKINSNTKEIDNIKNIDAQNLELMDLDIISIYDSDDMAEIEEENKIASPLTLPTTNPNKNPSNRITTPYNKTISTVNNQNQSNFVNSSKSHNYTTITTPNAGQKDSISNHRQDKNNAKKLSDNMSNVNSKNHKALPSNKNKTQHISQKNNISINKNNSQNIIDLTINHVNKINSPHATTLNTVKSQEIKERNSINLLSVPDESELSPIIYRNRPKKLILDDDDDDDDEYDFSVEETKIENPKRLKKRIIDDDDDEDDDEDDDNSKNDNNHFNINKDQPKRKSKQNNHWVANPFLDMEAERSDDDIQTGDEDDLLDETSNLMESFIYDGSSELIESNSVSHVESPTTSSTTKQPKKLNDLAMYRTSLLQSNDNNHRKNRWLDKIQTDKWEAINEDDDEICMDLNEDTDNDDDDGDIENIDLSIVDESGDFSSDFM